MKTILSLAACLMLCASAAALPSLAEAAAAAQGAVTGAATAAVDTVAGVLPDAVGAVEGVVAGVQEEGQKVWESVVDLINSKNGTAELWAAVQAASGALDITDFEAGNWTGTVFAPVDSAFEDPAVAALLEGGDEALLATLLTYHFVPGQPLTLADLEAMDGQLLTTLLGEGEGDLQVMVTGAAKKPVLKTSSGQRVRIYQYDMKAGSAIVHTIKGVLLPGNETLTAAAPSPTAAPSPAASKTLAAGVAMRGDGKCWYKVSAGDFFYGIADRLKVSAEELQKMNPQIVRIESLPLGSELNVPC